MGYRGSISWKRGWTKLPLKEVIKEVEKFLFEFSQTSAFDCGVRLSETEAYLQGLKDAQKLKSN